MKETSIDLVVLAGHVGLYGAVGLIDILLLRGRLGRLVKRHRYICAALGIIWLELVLVTLAFHEGFHRGEIGQSFTGAIFDSIVPFRVPQELGMWLPLFFFYLAISGVTALVFYRLSRSAAKNASDEK